MPFAGANNKYGATRYMFKTTIVRKRPQQTRANTSVGASDLKLGWCAALLIGAVAATTPAFAQQKTGPGLPEDDSLTWRGITLYGVVDLGYQFDTHSAPFTPYRPSASGNIVRNNSRNNSADGLTPSNMGQTRVG